MLARLNVAAVVLAASLPAVSGQTFQRLGTCPSLGCLLPPDQSDFLPGQLFDLRVEVHAPVNGSEAAHDGKPDEKFTVTIAKEGKEPQDITKVFNIEEPKVEKWTFKWYEDLFAEDAKTPSVVNVASKAYRKLFLNEPGKYIVTLEYYNGEKTTAEWLVRPIVKERKAKNVIFFIGDGMTTNMVSRAYEGLFNFFNFLIIFFACVAGNSTKRLTTRRLLPPDCLDTRASMANTRLACRWTSSPSLATK